MPTEMDFVNYKEFVENLPEATEYASGDKAVVSNATDGPRQMPKNTAEVIQAQKTLVGNMAVAFDESGETDYFAGESVVRGGKSYTFVNDHSGVWDVEDVEDRVQSKIDADLLNMLKDYVLVGTRNMFKDARFAPYSSVRFGNGKYNQVVGDNNANYIATKSFIPVEVGKTYCISRDGSFGNLPYGATCYIFKYASDKSFIEYVDITSTHSYTIPTGVAYVRFKFMKTGATVAMSSLDKYQIEEGATPTQYVYPFAVGKIGVGEVKKDNLEPKAVEPEKTSFFKKSTKNLFIGRLNAYARLNLETGAYEEGTEYLNQAANPVYIPVEEGLYTFNYEASFSGASTFVHTYDVNKNYIERIVIEKAASVSIGSSVKYVRISLSNTGATEQLATAYDVQLEKGGVPTEYEEPFVIDAKYLVYPNVSPEKTTFFAKSKNLFVGSFNAFAKFDPNGVYSEGAANLNQAANPEYIPVEEGDYFISYKKAFGGESVFVCTYGAGKTFIERFYVNPGNYISVGSAVKYVRVSLYKLNATEQLAGAYDVQLEKGRSSTEYVDPFVIPSKYIEIRESAKTEALSDANLKQTFTRNLMVSHLADGLSRTLPANVYKELIAGAVAVSNRHLSKSEGIVRIAIITDMHLGGVRTTTHDPTYNVEALTYLANHSNADVVLSLGDLITDYYNATYMNGIGMAKDAEEAAHDLFENIEIPYYVVKGNHDVGVNGYSEVETPEEYADGYYGIDPESQSIYRITEENFASYKASGLPFYQLTGYTYFDNQEIQDICLDGYCPDAVFNQADPYGFYYYFDIAEKVRVIVLNDFYNNGGDAGTSTRTSRSPYEASWLSDVLDDALENGLTVVTASHVADGMSNSSVGELLVGFVQNGGQYVGHLHGHTHCDQYTKNYNFNNIGFNASLISKSGDQNYAAKYEGYVFSLVEIDVANKLVRDIRVGAYNDRGARDEAGPRLMRSEDRVFCFKNGEHSELI